MIIRMKFLVENIFVVKSSVVIFSKLCHDAFCIFVKKGDWLTELQDDTFTSRSAPQKHTFYKFAKKYDNFSRPHPCPYVIRSWMKTSRKESWLVHLMAHLGRQNVRNFTKPLPFKKCAEYTRHEHFISHSWKWNIKLNVLTENLCWCWYVIRCNETTE